MKKERLFLYKNDFTKFPYFIKDSNKNLIGWFEKIEDAEKFCAENDYVLSLIYIKEQKFC